MLVPHLISVYSFQYYSHCIQVFHIIFILLNYGIAQAAMALLRQLYQCSGSYALAVASITLLWPL